MLRPPLPPLNALRAFEAAARHLSLRTAAEELSVTPPAISHQIKSLEQHLGFALFERLRRGVRLTDRGAAYFQRVSRALDAVSNATREIRHDSLPRTLCIAVPPHLLSGWMIARLPAFIERHSIGDLRIIDTVRRVDFDAEGIDAQILWGTGTWAGLDLDRLIEDRLCIVCSPGFLAQAGPISSLADAVGLPLIHTDRRPVTWDRLMDSAGVTRPARSRNIVVLRPMPAVQAAVRGLGLAIASRICVSDLLASGALVVPFEHGFDAMPALSYYLARSASRTAQARLDDLHEWLRVEMGRTLG